MTTTTRENIVSGSWNEVASGSASVTVQLLTDGPIIAFVGASEPAADSEVGILLDRDAESSLSLNSLTETDNVYLRCKEDGDTDIATVIAT